MTDYVDREDRVLVDLTLSGVNEAYEELVLRHKRSVLGTAYKVTHHLSSAEEAAQEAFIAAWMHLDSLRDRDKYGCWVCAIAKNCAHAAISHSHTPEISLHSLLEIDVQPPWDEWLTEEWDARHLHEAVNGLSDKIGTVVRLYYFEGFSIKEIAHMVSLPEGTVKWRLSEGRDQLRREYGITQPSEKKRNALHNRVMAKLEHLKRWMIAEDTHDFPPEYDSVLAAIHTLPEGSEKQHALADLLLHGYWWRPDIDTDAMRARIREAATAGHNDEVMASLALGEIQPYRGVERIEFLRNILIPRYQTEGYPRTAGTLYFQLGYAYRRRERYGEALDAFQAAARLLPPHTLDHATAQAAIRAESWAMEIQQRPDVRRVGVGVIGEEYRLLDGKWYLWKQPGYTASTSNASILFHAASCGRLLLDPGMKPGDRITMDGGHMSLLYEETPITVTVPAGTFAGCVRFVCEGNRTKLGHVRTVTDFCPGVGIVSQRTEEHGTASEWVLDWYTISGGEGLLPFHPGNRWRYSPAIPSQECEEEWREEYEILHCTEDRVIVAITNTHRFGDYQDTWEGQVLRAQDMYYHKDATGYPALQDVRPILQHARELATTRRQIRHTQIALSVMDAILSHSCSLTPDTTRIGTWNFFQCKEVHRIHGTVSLLATPYGFEWKSTMDGPGAATVRCSLFSSILHRALGCLYSEKWVDGYTLPDTEHRSDLQVQGGLSIQTPAGVFQNCIRLSYDSMHLPPSLAYQNGHMEFDFAPEVGLIRFSRTGEDGIPIVWQLVLYTKTGEGYFPTDNGIFRRYEPSRLMDGFDACTEWLFDQEGDHTLLFLRITGSQDRRAWEIAEAQRAKQYLEQCERKKM